MTIGLGAMGPNAGLAVFRALAVAERVGEGSIGGFAAFAAIDAEGHLHRAETQRGGSATLFVSGECTGVEPPEKIATAPIAAVMSSGPDRPDPLSQFIAADPKIGLVTGHRLPNAAWFGGVPVNEQVLAAMADGFSTREALDKVLDAHPEIDAGMIAINYSGGISARNSRLVAERPDLGWSYKVNEHGSAVHVLVNAIHPAKSLATLVAEIAMGVLTRQLAPLGHAIVKCGTPLVLGTANRLVINDAGVATHVEVMSRLLLDERLMCAAIYLGAEVVQNGIVLGTTSLEPNVLVDGGKIVRLSGQKVFSVPYVELVPSRA